MCYSYEASVFAGSVSYISSFILMTRNQGYDRWLALFILSFSSIQWAEAALWKNLDNVEMNQFITSWIIPIILASEGLTALLGANLYHDIDPYLWLLYIIIALILIFSVNKASITTIGNGSLSWGPNDKIYLHILFTVYLVLPFCLYMEDNLDKITITFGVIAILMYSIINKNKSISSNWCYYANALSMYALVRPHIHI